jgi:hypothetical protein
MMMMFNNPRRFSLSFAALALVVAPFGCNSDAPPPAVVEVAPTRTQPQVPVLEQVERAVDRDVRQTSGEVKLEGGSLKDDVNQAADDAKKTVEGTKDEVKAAEENLKKSAEGAVDNLLGAPK